MGHTAPEALVDAVPNRGEKPRADPLCKIRASQRLGVVWRRRVCDHLAHVRRSDIIEHPAEPHAHRPENVEKQTRGYFG